MKKDCPAKLVLAARRATQELEITEIHMQDNHEVSNETFKSYPECRQLCDDEVSFVKPLLELKVRPSMIVAKLKEQTGKAVIAKDLHNLKRSTYGQDEAALLQDQLKHCKTAYGAKTVCHRHR